MYKLYKTYYRRGVVRVKDVMFVEFFKYITDIRVVGSLPCVLVLTVQECWD